MGQEMFIVCQAIQNSLSNTYGNAPDHSALAGVYIEEGDFKNARLCLEQANIIPTLNENTHISIIYNYYELEKAEGNIENALTYLEQYNEAADSILALQNKASIII